MLQNTRKAIFYFLYAYWIVTILGTLMTVLFAYLFDPPSPEALGVTASQAPAYLMTIPYHPLLNLVVWPWFAWLYLRNVPGLRTPGNEELRLWAFWAVITIVIDLIGWVLIPHPWAMTFKEFYVDYQPWITMIYLIIFVTPIAILTLVKRQQMA